MQSSELPSWIVKHTGPECLHDAMTLFQPGLLSAQVASASGVIRLAARVAKKNKKLGAEMVPNNKWDVIDFNMGTYGM